MTPSDLLLSLSLVASPVAGQSEATPERVGGFVAAVRASTARYRDRAAAIADGYRPIGPDFPTMGEHWLNLALVVRDEVDPLRPPILEYVTVGGQATLAGVAYTQLVRDGVIRGPLPAPESAWHFHAGTVDEESFILSHAGRRTAPAADSGRARIAVLHAWLWVDNPAGLFATDNWTLPWHRLGLPPPEWVDQASPAGLAVALAGGGEGYFVTLLKLRHTLTAEQRTAAATLLRRHAQSLRALLLDGIARATPATEPELTRAWFAIDAELRTVCMSCGLFEPERHH